MNRSIVSLVVPFIVLLNACASPVEIGDIELDALAKKKPVPMAPLAGLGSSCKADLDCMPTTKPCGVAACVEGICSAALLPEGDPCQGGVGRCDAAGTCEKVDGTCKGWDGPVLRPCDAASECDDGSPCTTDTCQAGWCHHDPLPDGQACNGLLSCKQGLCCVPD